VSHMNRTLFLRIADTMALVAICSITGVLALNIGMTLWGTGMIALGAGFLAEDLWRLVRGALRPQAAGRAPDALTWRRRPTTSGAIALRANGR
jgi:hypothetical protein